MEQKRKNYSLFTTYDGRGRRYIVYREVREGTDKVFNQPTDSRGKKLCSNDPQIRLTLEVRNWI